MTHLPLSPVSESALSVLIKQYALDLRRNASGGDDYPYDFAKGVADYLGILIKRAKGDCACAQAGFPDSCDNCDGFAQCQREQDLEGALRDALCELSSLALQVGVKTGGSVHRAQIRARAALSDTSTLRHGACQVCGEPADLTCGPSRFGDKTWACKDCWEPDTRPDREGQ